MAIEAARKHLSRWGREKDILEFQVSTATVELAAAAAGVEPARIAKTLTYKIGEGALIVVAAGDARTDNAKFKNVFGIKPRMLSAAEALQHTGHSVGGICPFGLSNALPVWLDISLRRFETVYPACGSGNSAIELTCPELETYSGASGWVDVCKGWNKEEFEMEQKKLRHVVMFKFNQTVSESDIAGVTAAFAALSKQVPGIDDFEWGTDISPEGLGQGFTHCYVLTFHAEADRDAYLPHPAHKEFGTLIGPLLAGVFVVDYWAN